MTGLHSSCVKCELFLATSSSPFFIDLYLKSQEKVSRKCTVQKQLLVADLLERQHEAPCCRNPARVMSESSPDPCASVCISACLDGIHCLLHGLLLYSRQ